MYRMNPKDCINRAEAIRYLGYGEDLPDENIMEELIVCEEKIVSVLKPRYMFRVFPIEREEESIFVGNHALELKGNAIKEHLKGCDYVALGCATLSEDVDTLIEETQKKDMLHSLLLDSLANAAIEEVRLRLEETLSFEYEEYDINWQFGIGYGDLPLSTQGGFLELIQAETELGVRANDAFVLIPLKSVSGFIGLKRKDDFNENAPDREGSKGMGRTCGLNQCNRCNMKERCIFKKR